MAGLMAALLAGSPLAALAAGGSAHVPPGAKAGQKVMLWADLSGQVTGSPLGRAQVAANAAFAAVVAPAARGLLLLLAGCLARRMLDRQGLAAWEAAWAATSPQRGIG